MRVKLWEENDTRAKHCWMTFECVMFFLALGCLSLDPFPSLFSLRLFLWCCFLFPCSFELVLFATSFQFYSEYFCPVSEIKCCGWGWLTVYALSLLQLVCSVSSWFSYFLSCVFLLQVMQILVLWSGTILHHIINRQKLLTMENRGDKSHGQMQMLSYFLEVYRTSVM